MRLLAGFGRSSGVSFFGIKGGVVSIFKPVTHLICAKYLRLRISPARRVNPALRIFDGGRRMLLSQMIPVVVTSSLALGGALWATKRRSREDKDLVAIATSLLHQTGYRVASAMDAPFEEHVRLVARSLSTFGGAEG